MKKVLFSIFFFSLLAIGAQAQKSSCAKSCAAKPASASASCGSKSSSSVATLNSMETTTAAAKLASMDPTIESRTCPVSGTVSYVRKETSGNSQKVSYVDVSYDASSNTFVNMSPSKMEGGHEGCGTAKAASASGKGCCAGTAAAGKACCAGKGKATKATSASSADGKAIRTSGPIQ